MSFESIIQRVESMPPLPESVIKVEKLFAQSDPSLNELVKIFEEDSVLTADILAMVNAPLYAFSKEIVSVHQAVTLFGMNAIRGLVLSSLLKKSFVFDMSPYNISNREFQEVSSLQSHFMFQWYMSINIEDAAFLVPIAFLMETGKLIIANEVSKSDYKAEFSRMIEEEESIAETEKLFTGFSSSEVTALLLEHWNFNETFVEIIKGSSDLRSVDDEYLQYAQSLDIVKSLINIHEVFTSQSITKATRKVSEYDFDLGKFGRTLKRVQKKRE
jgi:HD-like signal output (HDOD) protein